MRDDDKEAVLDVAKQLQDLGFRIVATHGTAKFFRARGVAADGVNKVLEGRPHCVDAIVNGEFSIVIAGLGMGLEPQLEPLAAAYVLLLAIVGPILARIAR